MALPMHIRREGPLPVVTFATDSRLGFSDEDIADLTRLVDLMGAVTEMHIERSVAETVANTYLGPEVGQRVLNGAIRRGEGEELRAVLWFSDLRDFTGMNERLPAGEVLELLNNYLQLVGDALGANGGEILKFIGDGVMGYFPAEDALFLPMVTGQALAAARRLIADIEAANEARAAGGRDPLRFGVGLHVGDVTFGNVGTEDRLDFTVIGPAVNRASRLEGLTKELDVPVLRVGRVQRSLHGADEVARQASCCAACPIRSRSSPCRTESRARPGPSSPRPSPAPPRRAGAGSRHRPRADRRAGARRRARAPCRPACRRRRTCPGRSCRPAQ